MKQAKDRTDDDRWGYKQAVAERLDETIDHIVKYFAPEKIILFGSYAWGTPHAESDVDLLVVKETENVWDLTREISSSTIDRRFPMDVLVYSPNRIARRLQIKDPFVERIMRDGKVLYERG